MQIKKFLLVISYLFELSLAFKRCSMPHKRKSICFTNETGGYSIPYPVRLSVEVNLEEIIRIDQDMNSVSIRLNLWTYWIDLGLGLSNDECPK